MTETVLTLPGSLRSALKEPMGPVYTDAGALLADADPPVLAVGDVVTAHLLEAGHTPAVAIVDERTERSAVDDWVAGAIADAEGFDREVTVSNRAATLSAPLLSALRRAVADAGDAATLLTVDGEEDLATLPALVVAPPGSTAVYGQPGEGMVRVAVDDATAAEARDLLVRMDGDTDRLWTLLEVSG